MIRLTPTESSAWTKNVRARVRKVPAARMNKLEVAWHFELVKLQRDGQMDML